MTIAFELRPGDANKNGTKTIRVYVSRNGKTYFTTDHKVVPSLWDKKRQRIRETHPNAFILNSALTTLRNEIESICVKNSNLNAKDIVRLIGKNSVDTLSSFWKKFVQDCENGKHKRSLSTVKKYREALGSIEKFDEKYNRRTDFDTINNEWYDSYLGYLRIERKVNETTIGNHIKLIKAVMRMACDMGVSTNVEYKKRYFKKTSQESDSIYLTEEEIGLWEKVDLSGLKHLQAERDRFLISYYFLLRFGDSLEVNKSNVFTQGKKSFLKTISGKTKTEVIIPINPKALILLNKYDYKLPVITNQEANWKLKEIGHEAEIKTVVTCGKETLQKYHFITSHTARRSAATHLYFQGLPIKELSHLLGHSKISQTEEYIKVSKLESAKKALNYAFFK